MYKCLLDFYNKSNDSNYIKIPNSDINNIYNNNNSEYMNCMNNIQTNPQTGINYVHVIFIGIISLLLAACTYIYQKIASYGNMA